MDGKPRVLVIGPWIFSSDVLLSCVRNVNMYRATARPPYVVYAYGKNTVKEVLDFCDGIEAMGFEPVIVNDKCEPLGDLLFYSVWVFNIDSAKETTQQWMTRASVWNEESVQKQKVEEPEVEDASTTGKCPHM